jgi:hypothetical protein
VLRGVLLACALSFAAAAADPATGSRATDGDLAEDFACEVGRRLEIPQEARREYAGRLELALASAGVDLQALVPQHVILVDRSPRVQAILLFRLAPGGGWRFTGAAPVSTGAPGSFEHFETPLGVFTHTLDNLDFRAEGTRNDNGVRGYGAAGMRVFDFGWVGAPKGWGNHARSEMRLQMHATDPELLEPALGRARSKGCIRIPAALDEFLDRRGVLDADYEEAVAEGRSFWVLRPERETTRWPGRYLVVIDTRRAERPPWSPPPGARAPAPPRPESCPATVK